MEYVDGQEHHSEPPLSLLKAALLRRAAEDVRRGLVIRKARQACGVLLNKGSIGIDVSKELDRAGEELDNEAIDVAAEVRVPGTPMPNANFPRRMPWHQK
jgi:translocation protein SEC66